MNRCVILMWIWKFSSLNPPSEATLTFGCPSSFHTLHDVIVSKYFACALDFSCFQFPICVCLHIDYCHYISWCHVELNGFWFWLQFIRWFEGNTLIIGDFHRHYHMIAEFRVFRGLVNYRTNKPADFFHYWSVMLVAIQFVHMIMQINVIKFMVDVFCSVLRIVTHCILIDMQHRWIYQPKTVTPKKLLPTKAKSNRSGRISLKEQIKRLILFSM